MGQIQDFQLERVKGCYLNRHVYIILCFNVLESNYALLSGPSWVIPAI